MKRTGFLKRGTPIRKRGKRAWSATEPAGLGTCTYCWKFAQLTWDHVVPRSINPGPTRDDPRGLVRACWPCNGGREAGFYPLWKRLPQSAQTFVAETIGLERAKKYFVGVTDVPIAD